MDISKTFSRKLPWGSKATTEGDVMMKLTRINGVTAEELENYNPEFYDAIPQPGGTFDLVPVKWWDQASYNDYQYGTGAWDLD